MSQERVPPIYTLRVMTALGVSFASEQLRCSTQILHRAKRDGLVLAVIEVRAIELMADEPNWRRIVARRNGA